MEQNPYEPPRELEKFARKPLTVRQVLFWAMTIIGLPLSLVAAGCSLCFGLGSLYLFSDPSRRDATSLLVCLTMAAVFALLSASIGWAWFRALTRFKKEQAVAAERTHRRSSIYAPHDPDAE